MSPWPSTRTGCTGTMLSDSRGTSGRRASPRSRSRTSGSSALLPIWELAGSLAIELEEMVEDLSATLERLHQLAKLAPGFAEGDAEEEDS